MSAAGLDSTSHTSHRLQMLATEGPPGSAPWSIVGKHLSVTSCVMVTGFVGVGAGAANTMTPVHVDIFRATNTLTAEEAFAADPTMGNFFHAPQTSFLNPPTPWGLTQGGAPTFITTVAIPPKVLTPGQYVFVVAVENTGGVWTWMESDLDHGSAIWRTYGDPPGYFTLTDLGFPTGTPAWNITVQPIPDPAIVVQPPAALRICPGSSTAITIVAQHDLQVSYQWRHNGAVLSNQPGRIAGAGSPMLTIYNAVAGDAGIYDCMGATACLAPGTGALSTAAVLSVGPACPADADCNGLLQPADVAVFVNRWFASLQPPGSLDGDFDGNGAVQPGDLAAFVAAWLSSLVTGC